MREYSVIFDQVSVAAAQDLFSIKAAAGVPCQFIGVKLAQSTKAGDANNAQQRWRIRRGQTTQGSGGSTPTATPKGADTAAGGTVHVNDTTQASAGTIVTADNDVMNIEAGLIWFPPPDGQFIWQGGTCLTVEFPAVAVTATYNGTLYYRELS